MNKRKNIIRCKENTLCDKVHKWVQTSGIAIGSIVVFIWGVTTFSYEKIFVPKSLPVNITLDLSLIKTGINYSKKNDKNNPLVSIEMKVTAKNPSSRTVYLLPSIFIVRGINVEFPSITDYNFDKELINSTITSESNIEKTKHSGPNLSSIVAYGNLFGDAALQPGEIISICKSFHVPKRTYDMLQADICIPSLTIDQGIQLEWRYDEVMHDFNQIVTVNKHPFLGFILFDMKNPKILNENNADDHKLLSKFGYGYFKSRSLICLW